jgi:hypothetical protein
MRFLLLAETKAERSPSFSALSISPAAKSSGYEASNAEARKIYAVLLGADAESRQEGHNLSREAISYKRPDTVAASHALWRTNLFVLHNSGTGLLSYAEL